MISKYIYEKQGIELNYFEIRNNVQPLVLIHAQGVDAASFDHVISLFPFPHSYITSLGRSIKSFQKTQVLLSSSCAFSKSP